MCSTEVSVLYLVQHMGHLYITTANNEIVDRELYIKIAHQGLFMDLAHYIFATIKHNYDTKHTYIYYRLNPHVSSYPEYLHEDVRYIIDLSKLDSESS
jgi:hypothetical protein